MAEALSVAGIGTRYGKHVVFDDLSLAVAEGEIFGLIGLNGVGKTTLVKSILTLVRPTKGTVRIFDRDHRDPASRAKLAYLPEKFQPPPILTGAEFVRFSMAFYGRPFDRARVGERAEQLGLAADALDRRMGVYSKGMSQKLGLLATFMTELPLLMLDEPMSGLDPKARILLKQEIADYRARGGTVFLSSHILADLDELCDHIAILHDGGMAYDGSPADLKRRENTNSLERAFLGAIEGRPGDAA